MVVDSSPRFYFSALKLMMLNPLLVSCSQKSILSVRKSSDMKETLIKSTIRRNELELNDIYCPYTIEKWQLVQQNSYASNSCTYCFSVRKRGNWHFQDVLYGPGGTP